MLTRGFTMICLIVSIMGMFGAVAVADLTRSRGTTLASDVSCIERTSCIR
ncbi:hypothetical protein EL18_01652 [Nitratireductor basaltis]|uniref:Uncharacterized protein n=1 Tax=Nitratireductor basaltis TaxID=472175 RepID=A0A084UCC8_9HYPH|nr:hypothetical protein EL18_01652 [Nitratireductor basaltis]